MTTIQHKVISIIDERPDSMNLWWKMKQVNKASEILLKDVQESERMKCENQIFEIKPEHMIAFSKFASPFLANSYAAAGNICRLLREIPKNDYEFFSNFSKPLISEMCLTNKLNILALSITIPIQSRDSFSSFITLIKDLKGINKHDAIISLNLLNEGFRNKFRQDTFRLLKNLQRKDKVDVISRLVKLHEANKWDRVERLNDFLEDNPEQATFQRITELLKVPLHVKYPNQEIDLKNNPIMAWAIQLVLLQI
jgi:hypothetical protein